MDHFLHMHKKKYRNQRKKLKELLKRDEYRFKVGNKVTDRRLRKFWNRRKSLFSLVDKGNIYLTDELWYSVTPEVMAKFIAKFIKACIPEATTVLDVFCGGGGNSIQFAKVFDKVYGVDLNLDHLYCTYKNAQAYNVIDRIWLKYGDWVEIAKKGRFQDVKIDCIFASPPWGGPEYLKQEKFDLEKSLIPVPLSDALASFFKLCSNVVMFLPKNSDLAQLSEITARLLGPDAKCKVLYMKKEGWLQGLMCFWGKAFYEYPTSDAEERAPKRCELDYD
ncbi:HEL145Cp [Eremothecium sinecaudum]|uniref:Trimethylguanosine synthase n=1 Tax=Eremothecium sinecaudum TaxID=45286 RepID=A0A120K2C8_9SACH|nr:HEL145Cp [Eremothecium sinecaudum]AMD21136.1 HEL145Cp [Eremothecium sinecaudum]